MAKPASIVMLVFAAMATVSLLQFTAEFGPALTEAGP
jgi:hypothetical protein